MRPRTMAALVLLAMHGLTACSPSDMSKHSPMLAQSQVLSVFKMVETFQAVHLTERDAFAPTLVKLKSDGYSASGITAIVSAQAKGESVNGYVYKDIVTDEHGGALDSATRYGLAALPEKPGSGTAFLLLLDLRKMQVSEEGMSSNGIGGEMYKSETASLSEPSWPSLEQLGRWNKLVRPSPKEGLEAAKDLTQNYNNGRR